MPVEAVVWWTSAAVLVVAAGFDLRTWRVPNWLTVPFLVSGLLFHMVNGGLAGAGRSMAGIAVACLFFGIPCFLGAMGLGDLKLLAGVGAWIGPGQLVTAAVFTALAGGVFGVIWAWWHGSLGAGLDRAGNLLTPWRARLSRSENRHVRMPGRAMPYAPAIAVGTLLSFFAR